MNQNKSNNGFEESSLKIESITFSEGVAIIVGANVGAGILSLAYAARKAGWPILFFWLIIAGVFTTISMLYVAETTLRTKVALQLSGLAEKYVGSFGSWAIFASVVINSLGCLIAYMSGSGRILNSFFGIPNSVGSLIFFIPAVIIVWLGLKVTGVAEKVISVGMVIMVLILVIASFLTGKAEVSNIVSANWSYAIPVFNVAIFCYIAQYAVPELARGLAAQPKKLAPAISLGMFITCVLLSIVPLAVLALTGPEKVTEVATVAWGQAIGQWAFFMANIFALCAMMTSYWAVAESCLTNIVDKFKLKSEWDTKTRLIVLAIVTIPPFMLAYGGIVSFVNAVYLAGAFGGVIMSVVPVMMLNNARKFGDREPEWRCGIIAHPVVQILLIVLFCGAALYAVADLFNVLPAGW
ncbi:aromatic amino acid transport family protein [Clostridium peptidivorans]|uniref:aromatic amino acid transport family protein n=1 Tax=Clostridium peptidivorans TaxID=100174 RepID=UPI000BE40B40|nr:aromatic amino acid transport family protein [Clostridium peptidivorans]